MKIYIASDHAGYLLKEEVVKYLKTQNNLETYDLGTNSKESVDYPNYAKAVCKMLQNNNFKDCLGILICYTGIGMSITANKYQGIRASLVGKVEDAILTKEHNDANVLCLSAKNTNFEEAIDIIKAFITTKFLGERHLRRVDLIREIENEER